MNMKPSIRKLTINLVLLNTICLALLLFTVPSREIASSQAVMPEKILIIAETSVDAQLATEIMSKGPGAIGNYTLISDYTDDNLTQVLEDAHLEDYHTLVVIGGNLTSASFNSQIVDLLEARVSAGMSMALISSKLWQLDSHLKELLGVETPIQNGEFVPQYGKGFSLDIMNASTLKEPYSFITGQVLNVSARASYIENISLSTVNLASSTDLGGVPGRETGIYLKQYPSSMPGKLLTVPFTLQGLNDNNETIELIVSAVTDLIYHSSSILRAAINGTAVSTDLTTSSGSGTNTPKPFLPAFKESDVQAVVVGSVAVGGLLAAGYAVKQVTSSRKVVDPDEEDSKRWEPELGWILMVLAPLIAVFSQVIYSPKIRKIDLDRVKDNQIRQDILEILDINGFEHFNSLKKQLGTGVSVLKWHLQVLEDFELIRSISYGQFSVFYRVGSRPSQEDVKLYYTLRSNKALKIAAEFLTAHSWNVSNLSERLSMNRDTVKYHCYKLVSAGVVSVDEDSGIFTLIAERKDSLEKLIERSDLYPRINGA